MNTMWLTSAVLFVGGIASVVWALSCRPDKYGGWTGQAVTAGIIGAVAVIIGVAIPANVYITRAYGRTECSNWSHQTGRQIKFVTYTSWSTGDCLTRQDNGKWISKDNLREFGN